MPSDRTTALDDAFARLDAAAARRVYRHMTWKERIFGRAADTDAVVVYKNFTLAEWFFGKDPNSLRSMRIWTAIQRCVGLTGIAIGLAVIIGLLLR